MNKDWKPTLIRIADSLGAHNATLSTLSEEKAVIEKQQHETKIGTVKVLSALSQLVKDQLQFAEELEQLRFAEDFTKQCPNWGRQDPVSAARSQRLQQWQRSFPQSVQKLTVLANLLLEMTQSHSASAKAFASATQILHHDGILVVQNDIGEVQSACAKEAQRLTHAREDLIKALNKFNEDRTRIGRAAEVLGTRLEDIKETNGGLGFSLAGTGFGVASAGLIAVCPPVGAVFGVASLASSVLGLGLTASKRSKFKTFTRDAEELSRQAEQVNVDKQKLEDDVNVFVEQSQQVELAAAAVKFVLEKVNYMKSAAEVLERASVQRYSTSSSIGLRVSGIQSSSTALGMVTTQEHLVDCVEAILSDFSYSSQEHRLPQIEWEISTTNIPESMENRRDLDVRLEHIVLSPNGKLSGTVAVKNIAFTKLVIARYTFDSWITTFEVVADYNEGLHWKKEIDGFDRFNFIISLPAEANIDTKVMEVCVEYKVNGVSYWDNNGGRNFQVNFKTDDIALYNVLDDLVAGVQELSMYITTMKELEAVEEEVES